MTRKKRIWIFIASLLIIALGFGGWYYYQWKHPKADKLAELPADCDFLCTVNTHLIAEEILLSGDLKQADTGTVRKYLKSAGLDFLQPVWIIGSLQKKYWGIAAKISDEKKLTIFLKETLLAKYDAQNQQWTRDSFSFYQKTGYFYAFKGTIKNWKMGHPLGIHDTLAKKDLNGKILSGWCQLPDKWTQIISKNNGHHYFELTLNNEKNAAKSLQIITQNLSLEGSKFEAAEFPFMMQAPINLLGAFPEGKRKTYKFLKETGMDTTGIFNMQNGQFQFYFLGLDTIYNTSISYITDEEFNRKEIITKTPRIIPAFDGYFSSQSQTWYGKTRWDSTGKNGNLKTLFGIPIWISGQGLIYEIKNNQHSSRLKNSTDLNMGFWLMLNPEKLKKPAKVLMPAIIDYLSPDIAAVVAGKDANKNIDFLRIEFADNQKSIARSISDIINFYTHLNKK